MMNTPNNKVNMEAYLREPGRYELRPGTAADAPLCPYGNHYQWIGYDKQTEEYLRFTKSVFKKVIAEQSLTRSHSLNKAT